MIKLLTHLRFVRAATIPNVIPTTIAMTKATAPNFIVVGAALAIMSETIFCFFEIDSPKSP
ncbi:hypothetical protein SDC9_145184 [bioreactor metagenome]|uniref:Uncharacterized protein n=1 Tax=bioreactor metagenome TaxID=1076179 RepID=A0A645EB49_9ZZZZ